MIGHIMGMLRRCQVMSNRHRDRPLPVSPVRICSYRTASPAILRLVTRMHPSQDRYTTLYHSSINFLLSNAYFTAQGRGLTAEQCRRAASWYVREEVDEVDMDPNVGCVLFEVYSISVHHDMMQYAGVDSDGIDTHDVLHQCLLAYRFFQILWRDRLTSVRSQRSTLPVT